MKRKFVTVYLPIIVTTRIPGGFCCSNLVTLYDCIDSHHFRVLSRPFFLAVNASLTIILLRFQVVVCAENS